MILSLSTQQDKSRKYNKVLSSDKPIAASSVIDYVPPLLSREEYAYCKYPLGDDSFFGNDIAILSNPSHGPREKKN